MPEQAGPAPDLQPRIGETKAQHEARLSELVQPSSAEEMADQREMPRSADGRIDPAVDRGVVFDNERSRGAFDEDFREGITLAFSKARSYDELVQIANGYTGERHGQVDIVHDISGGKVQFAAKTPRGEMILSEMEAAHRRLNQPKTKTAEPDSGDKAPRVKSKAKDKAEPKPQADYSAGTRYQDRAAAAANTRSDSEPTAMPTAEDDATRQRWEAQATSDPKVAEAAAYREDEARRGNFELQDRLSQELGGIARAEFGDLVDKGQLIEQARKRLDEAINEGNVTGNKASDSYLETRRQVTETLDRGLTALGQLWRDSEGRHTVGAIKDDPEATLVAINTLNQAMKREAHPFERRNYTDPDTGLEIQELAFHTGDPQLITVEFWNMANGNLIKSEMIKGDNLTHLAPNVEPKGRLAALMLRLDTRIGSVKLYESLTPQTRATLGPVKKAEIGGSGGARDEGGAYGTLVGNYEKLGMPKTSAELVARRQRPRKTRGFWALLFAVGE